MADRSYAVIKQELENVDVTNLNSDSEWVQLARSRAREVFGPDVRPCLWQIKVALATLKGEKHVLLISRTGSGKTLTFWLPILLCNDGIVIVVLPLNILAKQNLDQLARAGISAVAITAETATTENFRKIASGEVRVVLTNPEMLMKTGESGFSQLFNNVDITSRIAAVILDEGHCVAQWGEFRPEYKEIGRLRSIIPSTIFHITSATLPEYIIDEVLDTLNISRDNLYTLRQSNDRANVGITVREIKSSLASFADLEFLVKRWAAGGPPPPKFLVLFDDIKDCVKACKHLRSFLPPHEVGKIKWHNSHMTSNFRSDTLDAFLRGELIGFFATDTLGMGMDIRDFGLVIQWRAEKLTMCSLMQRLGRAARDLSLNATFIIFAESKYFDRNKKPPTSEPTQTASGQHPCNPSGSRSMTQVQAPIQLTIEELKSNRKAIYANHYRAQQSASKNGTTANNNNIEDPGVDDTVNAAERGFNCRKLPANITFDNENISMFDHLECDDGGCPRCSPLPSIPCCDLCHPQAFDELFSLMESSPPPPHRPSKSSLKKYERGEPEIRLSHALHAWRQKKTKEKYSEAILRSIGSCLILTNELLKRLVDCAHYGKVTNMEQLKKEVDWVLADEFGSEVVSLILEFCPPQPRKRTKRTETASRRSNNRQPLAPNVRILNQPHSAAQQPALSFYNNPLLLPSITDSITSMVRAAPAPATTTAGVKRKRCTTCGQEGHNKRRHEKESEK